MSVIGTENSIKFPTIKRLPSNQPILRGAVVDRFDYSKGSIDIDGDGVLDKVSHGDLISLILGANSRRYAEVINFDFISNKDVPELIRIFGEIKKNNVCGSTIHAVNMSISASLHDFSTITIEILKGLTGLNLNPENLSNNRKKIIDFLKTSKKSDCNDTYKVIEAIEETIASGSKVFVSGCNSKLNAINLFGLAEGVINVGATNALGEIAAYSSQHSLIDIYRQGTHSITEVCEGNEVIGYSIINDGTVEIPVEKVSGGIPLIQQLAVTPKVLTNKKEWFPLKEKLLYPIEELLEEIKKLFTNVNSTNSYTYIKLLTEIKTVLEEAFGGRYISFLETDPQIMFSQSKQHWSRFVDINEDGKVIYDPDGSKRKAVNYIAGCSYAAPMAASEYLSSLHTHSLLR